MSPQGAAASRRGELAVAAGLLGLAALVFQQTATDFAAAGVASGGALNDAAFYPEIVAGLLAALAMLHAVALLRGGPVGASDAPRAAPDASLARAALLAAAFVLYLAALRPVGYHLTTPAFLAAAFAALGLRWWMALLLSPLMSLGASLIFERGMNVVLPVGRWGIGL